MPLSTILNGINPTHETRDQESQSSLIYKHPGGNFIAINEWFKKTKQQQHWKL